MTPTPQPASAPDGARTPGPAGPTEPAGPAEPGEQAGQVAGDHEHGETVQAAGFLLAAAQEQGLTLAVAESLTGGQVASTLVTVPGASAVLVGAVVAYATRIKAEVLGVDAERLARTGPVDGEVARQMATGVARLMGADLGLATTGVAGPGPADGHPAGTVHIAVSSPWGVIERELHLDGDREQVRSRTTTAVLVLASAVVEAGRG